MRFRLAVISAGFMHSLTRLVQRWLRVQVRVTDRFNRRSWSRLSGVDYQVFRSGSTEFVAKRIHWSL